MIITRTFGSIAALLDAIVHTATYDLLNTCARENKSSNGPSALSTNDNYTAWCDWVSSLTSSIGLSTRGWTNGEKALALCVYHFAFKLIEVDSTSAESTLCHISYDYLRKSFTMFITGEWECCPQDWEEVEEAVK